MFSTFTGNSRRPRNVNLSGSAGNPFANTSWSPSAVSNASKTVSNAQAEREKRQAERQKIKSAVKIQRMLLVVPKTDFPELFPLLLLVFSPRRDDDIRRAIRYARDTESVPLEAIVPSRTHPARLERLVRLLVEALDTSVSTGQLSEDAELLGKLAIRIIASSPNLVLPSVDRYYTVIAKLCQAQQLPGQWPDIVLEALSAPLGVDSASGTSKVYHAYAFSFLTSSNLSFFETNIAVLAKNISLPDLSRAIIEGQPFASNAQNSEDALLWQLAHFIDLGRSSTNTTTGSAILETLYTQLATLSSAISVRLPAKSSNEGLSDEDAAEAHLVLDPYIATKLTSLVESNGISQTLRDFFCQPSGIFTSRVSGSDDIRMRLFLEEIPTPSGDIPTVKFLWEQPIDVLRRYLGVTPSTSGASSSSAEEQDWRIILLFLELYIFILRLSDDEDFFSGIYPQLLQSNSSTSRIRSCSLSLEDVKPLTMFLKNTAFTLHYKAQELSKSREALEAAAKSRVNSYLGASISRPVQDATALSSLKGPARLGLDSLRSIVTVAMKMLYERDSRKQFLPTNHWLMTDKLDKEDFISAVIAEEKRQSEEDSGDSEGEEEEDPLRTFSTFGGQSLSRRIRLEQLKAQQTRAMRERRLAEMGPKLEILKHMPFVVPFETRVMIFRQFIQLDRGHREGNMPRHFNPFNKHHAQIRRKRLFEDAYKQFYELGEGFKDPIQITFVDQFGTPEAGIDGGGVTKEFLISVTSEAFSNHKGAGMFASNEKGLLFPDPTAMDVLRESLRESGLSEEDPEFREFVTSQLRRFEFLGRIVGKCMYEGILVDLAFAGFFLLKWASTGPNDENNYKGSVNDLRDMDEDLYNGMLRLKNYSGDISELGIDFTIEDQVSQPGQPVKTITKKLIANGDQVHVTNDNRLLYISYVARHRLVVQPSLQTAAFLRGLRGIIRPSWLSMFNQSELQRLVGGDSSEIDIDDLRRNTVYSGLYEIGDDGQEHDTIKLFWKVMRGFTDSQRRSVLKYVSSTPRAPLLGFSQLNPKFSIRDGGTDEDRLPSTSTCVNLLKLPRYKTEAVLREKLLYAVTSGAGFDLS
ncbi:hypothetical protein CEP52_000500 [Fusarium oligoseptatum]|uniref:HECT-type E3 ubiquitin transferase n=1 Tax=Fusarium oligoseptatum TaxID=2604345 RepID=A0A428UNY3_9HYPO|nr:hypothetical protein CEP52_000500 [Fusarium oligoseptatum]